MNCPECGSEVEINEIEDYSFKCSSKDCVFNLVPMTMRSIDLIKVYDSKLKRYQVEKEGRSAYIDKETRADNPYKNELKGYWDSGWQSEKERWENVKKIIDKQEVIEFYEDKIESIKNNLQSLSIFCEHFMIRGKAMKIKIEKIISWLEGVL